MSKQISISIPNPCHEKWGGMTATQQGAFCKSCKKQVIDFTTKTEDEIFKILAGATGKVCGRFADYQIDTPVTKSPKPQPLARWKAIAAGTALFFSAEKAIAVDTGNVTKAKAVNHLRAETDTVSGTRIFATGEVNFAPVIHEPVVDSISGHYKISAKVIDRNDGQPLEFAYVSIIGTTIGVSTDSNGYFEMDIDSNKMGTNNPTLKVSYIGYNSREDIKAANLREGGSKIIQMGERHMMGDMVITTVTVGKICVTHNTPAGKIKSAFHAVGWRLKHLFTKR